MWQHTYMFVLGNGNGCANLIFRSRVMWLNWKTHLSVNASSAFKQVCCIHISLPALRQRQQPRAEGSKYYFTHCFSCECVSMTRETLCMWKVWFPLSSPELSFWDICAVGWPWLDASTHQSLSATSLHSWAGERKCNQGFLGWDKDWERSIMKYYHGQNRLKFWI